MRSKRDTAARRSSVKETFKKLFANKTARIILICLVALVLLLAVWKVFFPSQSTAASSQGATEQESRLAVILSQIEGVKDVSVMIGEDDGGAVSAIVVFSGADGLLTRMRLVEATAAALNIERACVLVYPKQ